MEKLIGDDLDPSSSDESDSESDVTLIVRLIMNLTMIPMMNLMNNLLINAIIKSCCLITIKTSYCMFIVHYYTFILYNIDSIINKKYFCNSNFERSVLKCFF